MAALRALARVGGWLAALGVAVVLSGCGGHADGSRASSTGFASGFTAASQAYQTRMTNVQNQARTALKSHASDAELNVYRDLLAATDTSLAQFRKLTPPASARPAFASLVQALDAQDQALKAILAAANAGDANGLQSAVQAYGTALAQWQQQRSQVETALPAGSATAATTQ